MNFPSAKSLRRLLPSIANCWARHGTKDRLDNFDRAETLMRPISLRLFLITLTAFFVLANTSHAQNRVNEKKLIEFGWDEPDSQFMRKHIALMEGTPFDGTVFHVKYSTRKGKSGVFSW